MSENMRPPGRTTIAPEVWVTIARLTALSVPGVSRLADADVLRSVNRFFNREKFSEGVRITVENNTVYADLHVIIRHDSNVREVGRAIQNKVARAITEMVGMEVGRVNIHVEDIDYESATNDQMNS